MVAVKFIAFSEAPALEPALENMLRAADVHEDIIMPFRCRGLLTNAVFANQRST